MTRTAGTLWALRLLTAAGLVVDAVIHIRLAPNEPPAGAGQLSEEFLFRAEGVVSIVAALAVLVIGARWAYAVAVVVAATAVAAVLVSRYVDTGAIAFLPNLYEPLWYDTKIVATIAEVVALCTAVAGYALTQRPVPSRHTRSRTAAPVT